MPFAPSKKKAVEKLMANKAEAKKANQDRRKWLVGAVLVALAALGFALQIDWSDHRLLDESRKFLSQGDFGKALDRSETALRKFNTPAAMMQHARNLAEKARRGRQTPPEQCVRLFSQVCYADEMGPPHDYQACHELGSLFEEYGQSEYAIKAYLEGISKGPSDQELGRKRLGHLLERRGDLALARRSFNEAQAIEFDPYLELHLAVTLPLVYDTQDYYNSVPDKVEKLLAKLAQQQITIPDPLKMYEVPIFYLALSGHANVKIYKQVDALLRDAAPSLTFTSARVQRELEIRKRGQATPVSERPIRVGFSSSFFFENMGGPGRLERGLIELLPRDQFHVTLFTTRDPRLGQRSEELDRGLALRADKVVSLQRIHSLKDMRAKYVEEKLDVLVFMQLWQDVANYALAFARVAPVQLIVDPHGETAGIETLDYAVTYQPFQPPQAQDYYSEKLVTLSDIGYYPKPNLPEKFIARHEIWTSLEVPSTKHIYFCPQSVFKIYPVFDLAIKAILEADKDAVIVLKQMPNAPLTERFHLRLRSALPGLDDRLKLVKQMNATEWFSAVAHSDVILDSYPFGGYTTALEALAVGTPVVTLPHARLPAGRVSKALLELAELGELVAQDTTQYAQLATKLGMEKTYNEEMRRKIAGKADSLFQRDAATAEWATFLRQASENRPITQLYQK